MILTCPCCHARYPLDAVVQDEAARELLAMRAVMPPSLVPYLALFRTEKRALAWDRALKLAKEALELEPNIVRLETTLAETVEAIRAKREAGQVQPLKNHNYLKRVLESVATRPDVGAPLAAPGGLKSKRGQALAALEAHKRGR